MKTNNILLLIIIIVLLYACSKMNDTYKGFLQGGEILYTGKVDSLKAFPGKNRTLLTWLLVSDPKITKCRVFWNRKADSTEITVRRSPVTDTIKVMLDNLKENTYTFQVYTYDNMGHSSVKEEVIGNVYGEVYLSTLSNRPLKTARYDAAKKEAALQWYGVNNQVVSVEISYTTSAGTTKQLIQVADSIPANPLDPLEFRTTLKLPDYKPGIPFQYRTAYKPVKAAIDTFYTMHETVQVQ
ncbi:MAG TPA: DUF4998 domain-containing protein [Chitinophaga sp.]|uniref:DUF4998 domain-containing protein n=1 Tax=Chitinophaga sp. TaxID=1869181 RepID=UPI002C1673B2|nr:DUF4998 domain-containing protein [Chitinophaga sp.]HVI47498.1 DUF4998 domain-containing protein [Chitinophaga sp.]